MKPPQHRANANDEALQRAAFALQAQRPGDAEKIAGELLQKNPGDPRAAQIFGYSLIMQGRGAEAIAPLERAVQQSRDPALDTQLAMALRQAGRNDEALARFERAVKRQPPFPPAFLEYGSLLAFLGRSEEAIDVLQRGLALAPNFAEMHVQLGNALARHGGHEAAHQSFARALSCMPNDPDMLFNAARVMKDAACFAQAADAFRRMLALDPGETAARIGLGVCLLEIGQTEAGFESLRTASAAGPKMFGQTVNALASAGRGHFWLKPSDAVRALDEKKS